MTADRPAPPPDRVQTTDAPRPITSYWLDRLTIWHALALGLVVRLVVLVLLPDQGFPDAKAYLAAGQNLFASGNTGDHTYMPLYPIWTYLTGGGVTLKLADIALSLATTWVIYAVSLEILKDRSAALLAAFVAALWPHFAFYAVSGLTETAYTFVVTLGFLMLYRKRWRSGIALLVLSILIRPTLEPLIPILLIVFAVIVHRDTWRRAAGGTIRRHLRHRDVALVGAPVCPLRPVRAAQSGPRYCALFGQQPDQPQRRRRRL